jgi:hypothetical protein
VTRGISIKPSFLLPKFGLKLRDSPWLAGADPLMIPAGISQAKVL